MPLTKAQLRTRTAQSLGVLGASEQLSSADAQLIDKQIDEAFADLENVVTFMSDEIPDWAIESMVLYVGAIVAPFFGLQSAYNRDDAKGRLIAARDRRLGVGDEPVAVYF